jgi:AbrB family looped-hinge helix DNA binding protein
MSITIDRAGRLVIPKSIRDELNLVPGSELEIDAEGNEIRLRVAGTEPRLIEKDGILVYHGGAKTDIDIVEFIRSERDKRSNSQAGPWE